MAKPYECINVETGEVIPNWEIRRIRPAKIPQTRIRIDTDKDRFAYNNIGSYIKKEKKLEHDEFGPCFGLSGPKRKFTKKYKIPEFSKLEYRAYWCEVEGSLEMNTGIVMLKNDRIETLVQWAKLCKASEATMHRFVKECEKMGYFGRFVWKTYAYWIANPGFCWNGYMIPASIQKLFSK